MADLTTIEAHREALLVSLATLNPDAILYEPRAAFDRAIVGLALTPPDRWKGNRPTEGRWVAVYSFSRACDALLELDGGGPGSWDLIVDHVSVNSMGGWYGPDTPAWIDDFDEDVQLLGSHLLRWVGEPYEMT